MSTTVKLSYGFFKNPELHLNEQGAKPSWKEMFLDTKDSVMSFATTSEYDCLDTETNAVNNRRVVFFTNTLDSEGAPIPGANAKVDSILAWLAEHDLSMSPSSPYKAADGETRVSYIVHAMKGSTASAPSDY